MSISPIQPITFRAPSIIGGNIGSPVPVGAQAVIAPSRGNGGCWNPNIPTNPQDPRAGAEIIIQLPHPDSPIQ